MLAEVESAVMIDMSKTTEKLYGGKSLSRAEASTVLMRKRACF